VNGRGGLWRDARKRIAANRVAMLCLAILAMMTVVAIVGPMFLDYGQDEIDWTHMAVPPLSAEGHWLGTDRLGRDMLVRTLYGLRVSLGIALLATLVSLAIGVSWGAVAGYLRGRTDALMMRAVDILYALPQVFFVIILTVVLGRSPATLLLAIGAFGWLTMARIVRGQAMALREREFVEAAIVGGAGTARIVARHIIPNLLGPVIVYATLTVPQVILVESFLSFLGIGIQEPLASLGNLIADGAVEMETATWILVVPAACLVLIVFCFNFLGDGLRDALDPRDH
jgi:oligopeptide transport system permease protein